MLSSGNYNNPGAGAAFTADGWFRTGDMASIDRYGYVQLSDRKKDLIKRKGEWISSVDMENAVSSHPGVLEAAVVARRDEVATPPRRPRRPAPRPGSSGRGPGHHRPARRQVRQWQLPLPEDIHFIDSLPKTGVGKIDKKVLRTLVAAPPGPAAE